MYPENLHTVVDIMRVMPIKKAKKETRTPKQKEVTPVEEVGLVQASAKLCAFGVEIPIISESAKRRSYY